MAVDVYGLMPYGIGGSATTYYCDAQWYNNSNNRVAFYGGRADDGSWCGAFACHLYNALSYSYWRVGASPSSNRHGK